MHQRNSLEVIISSIDMNILKELDAFIATTDPNNDAIDIEFPRRRSKCGCQCTDISNHMDPELGPFDVICGRNRTAFNYCGCRRFRSTVAFYVNEYANADSRSMKARVVQDIVECVRESGGRFLFMRKGKWMELDDKKVKEKVGHALRDMAGSRGLRATKKNMMHSLMKASCERGSTTLETNVRLEQLTSQETLHTVLLHAGVGDFDFSDNEHSIIQMDSDRNVFLELLQSQLVLDDDAELLTLENLQ